MQLICRPLGRCLIRQAHLVNTTAPWVCLVAIIGGLARPLSAQGTAASWGWVQLTVRDSASGEPLTGAWARIDSTEGLAPLDSTGRFLFFRVPTGNREITIICPTRRWWFGPKVKRGPVLVRAADTTAIEARVPSEACLIPGLSSVGGEFRGHYRGGFEESSFRPCPGEQQPTGSPTLPWQAWVEFDSVASLRTGPWPTVPDTGYGLTWYVRFYGTLTGPGTYGHMGVSAYQLDVARVRQVRAPRKNDCPAPPGDW